MLAREVEVAAQELHGYRVLLANTYRSQEKESSFFQDLLSHGIRGVIVMSSLPDQKHFEAAVERGLVAVSYDRRAPANESPKLDYVSMDNFKAAHVATRHLIEHGHRRIAFATAAGRTLSRAEKIEGFRAAMADAGLSRIAAVLESKAKTAYGDAEMAELGRSVARTVAQRESRPTGIVAVNDMLAIGLIGELRKQGLRVPEDVSVVGMDDLFLAPLLYPPLTTIQPPLRDLARTMVNRVMTRMADGAIPAREFLFDPVLIRRDTVSRPRSQPPQPRNQGK